jgi:hypothetical protein
MAIDTQEKRLSLMQLGRVATITLPEPVGGIDQGDRQHFLRLYSGILAAAPVELGETGPLFTARARPRDFTARVRDREFVARLRKGPD